MIVDEITNIGHHYARTLREWKEIFLRNFESSTDNVQGDATVFRRKWEYYFTYREAGFN